MPRRSRAAPPSALDWKISLEDMNPWWQPPHTVSPIDAPPTRRALATLLPQRLLTDEPHRFHLLVGPRRVGKTTIMYQVVESLLAAGVEPKRVVWVRLDHPLLLEDGLQSILSMARHLATGATPLFLLLDELTYARDWDLWLKTAYDERFPVRIVATSSATAALRRGAGDSGVGRWEIHPVAPLTLSESMDLAGLSPPPSRPVSLAAALQEPSTAEHSEILRELLQFGGGFPEQILHRDGSVADRALKAQKDLRANAVERAIYQDMPQIFAIDDTMSVFRLLHVLAAQIGQVMSPTACAEIVRVSQPTIERYLGYLEQSYLVFTVPNWSPSEANVQRRGRKVYFFDTAVRNATLLKGAAAWADDSEAGSLRENLIASHLRTLAAAELVRVYYWRSQHGRSEVEVDFVYDHPAAPVAIEVGGRKHARKGLLALIDRRPELGGHSWLVLTDTPYRSARDSADGIGTIGIDAFLLAVGARLRTSLFETFGQEP